MIQFNLLPDVKLEYIKAKRTKRFVVLIAAGAGGTLLAITITLFVVVNILQKKHLNDLNGDIKVLSSELKDTQDLDKILTIQNQLNNLPGLHDAKPVASRLFGYLSQVTPSQLTIAKLDVDFAGKTISFTGGADALSTVNKFVDTLKFTNYTVGKEPQETKAFLDVVLADSGRDEKGATYRVEVKFDSSIFDSAKEIQLIVPKIITSRSETEKPTDLFQSGGSQQIKEGQ